MDTPDFEALYPQLRPRIEKRLRRAVDPATAAELTDETFARAWQSRHTHDSLRGSEAQWIHGIAHNVLAQHLRRASRTRPRPDTTASESHESTTIDRVDAAIALGAVAALIAGLNADELELIAPVIIAALGGLEVGRRTNTEHLRLHRLRKRLQTALNPRSTTNHTI